MKRSTAIATVILLALFTVFSGCSSKAGSQAESGGAKIRLTSQDNAGGLDKQQALVGQFSSSHGDIEVAPEAYGSEYSTRISAGMGSGDTPDVLYIWDYSSYYEGLEPLDSYIERGGTGYKNNFYDALWPYNSKNNAVYGIPVGFITHALYYNKDISAQAGVAEPTDDWTWDGVKTTAEAITDSMSGVKGFSFQMKPDPYDYKMYLWSNENSFVDANGNLDGNLNSANSVEVVSLFQEMEKGGYATIAEKNDTDEFRSDQTTMYIYGAWAVFIFDEDGLNYGTVDIPAFVGVGRDSVSILSSSGTSISKGPKSREAVWELVRYWTGEEVNKVRIGYELPTLKSMVEPEKALDGPSSAPSYSALEQSSGFAPASFIVGNQSTLKDTLDSTSERVYNPGTPEDPAAMLSEAILEMQ